MSCLSQFAEFDSSLNLLNKGFLKTFKMAVTMPHSKTIMKYSFLSQNNPSEYSKIKKFHFMGSNQNFMQYNNTFRSENLNSEKSVIGQG